MDLQGAVSPKAEVKDTERRERNNVAKSKGNPGMNWGLVITEYQTSNPLTHTSQNVLRICVCILPAHVIPSRGWNK